LLPGGALFDRDAVSADDLLPWYKEKYLGQFNVVVLDQFKVRLKSHRKQASEDYAIASQEEEYFARDRKLYPRKTHNKRGEPIFDMPPAKPLLRQDIKDGIHLEYQTWRKLQSLRLAYKPFKAKIFQDRVLQEIRLKKSGLKSTFTTWN
jgi:hypothetical protein